jgi:acyl-CoA thioesterase-1
MVEVMARAFSLLRWSPLVLVVLVARALRVRLSVGPRRKYWASRYWASRYWASRSGPGELLVVALGDSLTQGIGSSRPGTSWLGRFTAHLESSTGRTVAIDNRAVYGARIADLISTQLPVPRGADLVVVCIGANDAGRTSPETFRAAVRTMCQALPSGSIVGDVPEFQWGPRIDAAAELSGIVRQVLAEFPDLILAQVEQYTLGTRILTELAGDFFHPSDLGYQRIADAFVNAADRVNLG